ncbi:MAG: hypothetical protein ACOH2H_00275 [Cypionkella sp.]
MNLVEGILTLSGTLRALEVDLPCPICAQQPVTLGFCPENATETSTDKAQVLSRILTIENTGDRLNLVVEVAGQPINTSLTGRGPFKDGEVIPLTITSEHLHLFSRETGKRID